MLSDEMTTGSVTSSDSHKRAFAARSHSWNIAQPRFKEVFPDVSNSSLSHLHLPPKLGLQTGNGNQTGRVLITTKTDPFLCLVPVLRSRPS